MKKQYIIVQEKNGQQSPGAILYDAYDKAQQVADKLNAKQPGARHWVAEAEVTVKGENKP